MQKKLTAKIMMDITEAQWKAGSKICGAIYAYKSRSSEATVDLSQGINPANTSVHALNILVKKSKAPIQEDQISRH